MDFELFTLARIIHVLAVILWIGGVAMVTTVLLPTVRKLKSKEDLISNFEKMEGRFAGQAKILTVLTALSGFYMLHELDAWDRYTQPGNFSCIGIQAGRFGKEGFKAHFFVYLVLKRAFVIPREPEDHPVELFHRSPLSLHFVYIMWVHTGKGHGKYSLVIHADGFVVQS